MIPVLYDHDEKLFESFGIGALKDCVSCQVTEERNGAFELEMQYPMSGKLYSEIKHERIILAKPNELSNPQPFRIYAISKPIDGIVTCHAAHISYDLADCPIPGVEVGGNAASALSALLGASVVPHGFTGWSDISTSNEMHIKEPCSVRSYLAGKEGSVLDIWGGEYEFDLFAVKLHAARGRDNGVTIEYGKNLTDINQEESIASTYTAVYPYAKYKPDDTEEDVIVTIPDKIVAAPSYLQHQKIMIRDFSEDFEDEEEITPEALKSKTEAYVKNNKIGIPAVNITLSFAQLWQSPEYRDKPLFERVSLCDPVTVRFKDLGVDAKAKVIKTVYDPLAEKYNSIEIGDAKSDFVDAVVGIQTEVQDTKKEMGTFPALWAQSIDEAAKKITGATDSNIILYPTEYPKTIYAMNTRDRATATKVLMINSEGILGSNSGINGPYNLAITLDGTINASRILTGELTANLIKAGTIRSINGESYWDLDTGNISMSGAFVNKDIYTKKKSVEIADNHIELYDWKKGEKAGSISTVVGSNVSLIIGAISGKRLEIGMHRDVWESYISVTDISTQNPITMWKNTVFKQKAECQNGLSIYGETDAEKTNFWGDVKLNKYWLWIDDNLRTVTYDNGWAGFKSSNDIVFTHGSNPKMRISDSIILSGNLDMSGYAVINQSDARLKTNISAPNVKALSLINAVDLKQYDWIESGKHQDMGIIAQQLETVAPHLVHVDEEGKYSIKMMEFIPYLIGAIQELSGGKKEAIWADPYTDAEKAEFVKKNKTIKMEEQKHAKRD